MLLHKTQLTEKGNLLLLARVLLFLFLADAGERRRCLVRAIRSLPTLALCSSGLLSILELIQSEPADPGQYANKRGTPFSS